MSPPLTTLPDPSGFAPHFVIDPDIVYLNHGSFGACSEEILRAQDTHRRNAERELVDFYVHNAWPLLDRSRRALGSLVKCAPEDLVFVHNATTGVASIATNHHLNPGDEILITNAAYPACANNLRRAADCAGASVNVVNLPWPNVTEDLIIDTIMGAVTPKTKLCMLSLVVSSLGYRLPVETLIPKLRDQGIETILDAAHGPGCIPMDIETWNPAYTTGNAHKWLCAPKGAAFLHVRKDLQKGFRPLVLSNDARNPEEAGKRTGRSAFNHEFDYAGTDDVSPYLTIADAIQWLSSFFDTGMDGLMAHNHALCMRGRDALLDVLNIEAPVPESMLGPLCTLPLGSLSQNVNDIKAALKNDHKIEVPVWTAPDGSPILRISAQLYNTEAQYTYLARALDTLRA